MMTPGFEVEPRDPPDAVEAARHLCQEARVVLTSLRGGPPVVARGELATDLMDLRTLVKAVLSECVSNSNNQNNNHGSFASLNSHFNPTRQVPPARGTPSTPSQPETPAPTAMEAPPEPVAAEPTPADSIFDDGLGDGTVFVEPHHRDEQPPPIPPQHPPPRRQSWFEDVGPFARPFLAVVVDPRAAGPHTLVALRSLFRLVEQGSLLQPNSTTPNNAHHPYTVLFESLTKGVLGCKFEQTDAGADEAVEMAIADLLALLVKKNQASIHAATLMEAFNTVFVTRNTFVHSPALCYHFEDVLTAVVSNVFSQFHPSVTSILEFLVNQLLHTPLVGGDVVDESMREAQMAHAATRLLCLRLVNCALRTGWDNEHFVEADSSSRINTTSDIAHGDAANATKSSPLEEKELLRIIKDDLCLSLLMTGQAIWTYHDASSSISPGLISLDVLAEICNTLATLWHTIPLRKHLVSQFETIFTGFYQRALVLLRKRTHPMDSMTFNADLVFDAEVEVILESLVDLLCLHDFRHSIADGNGGSLETLFATYDCHMSRSDVAIGLMVELCRCCGGSVNEEGDAVVTPRSSAMGTPAPASSSGASTPVRQNSSSIDNLSSIRGNKTEILWRPVPPHLKELCAQALMGAMKCLFRDDKASKETLLQRSRREMTIMLSGEELQQDPCHSEAEEGPSARNPNQNPESTSEDNDHFLRNIKSKKRLMRKAAMLFNQKASTGVDFLVSTGLFANPPTPASVASFLRNGIVVGLNKHAAGAYLGEAGKPRIAGKSPPDWERDWFHKEVLEAYCKLFRFEGQSLLDGLRMFLSSFRLPGEAQQIDRILQSFSDTCGAVCEESMTGRLKLFSTDPKRASDAAYLLSFSIIMLNTDLHNANIREDRKMKMSDFVKYNTDYGSDITEKGKEFPREFLEGIYESIKEEEIRTEGEGADGCMTIERWKDVLRGSTEELTDNTIPSKHDAEDLTELVLEHLWIPIMSAVGAFWGVARREDSLFEPKHAGPAGDGHQHGNMLGVQGARLGMDMALEMLEGVLQLRRVDIFRRIFACVCMYTGLVSEYTAGADERAALFSNSLEAQSGLIVAMQVARTASDDIGNDGWKLVWQMIFELRDLKMLGSGGKGEEFRRHNVLAESEADLLNTDARKKWNLWLLKGDVTSQRPQRGSSGVSSVLGAFGRVLFGSDEDAYVTDANDGGHASYNGKRSVHGKEELLVWDETAESDDEGESLNVGIGEDAFVVGAAQVRSIGAQFEYDLIRENIMLSHQAQMPVTGLERVEETRNRNHSRRSRVRNRVTRSCDFYGLVADSRFMTDDGISCMLRALLEVVDSQSAADGGNNEYQDPCSSPAAEIVMDLSLPVPPTCVFPLSPASLTYAEVLVCEIALRNKDRLVNLWKGLLEPHYSKRLAGISKEVNDRAEARKGIIASASEKCVTGLLRLSACATNKDVADDIIGGWSQLVSVTDGVVSEQSIMSILDKHISGGVWRIVNNVDGCSKLGPAGWQGLMTLISWCAARVGQPPALNANDLLGETTLAEDDPALQSYRSLHLMMNNKEVRDTVPYDIVGSIRSVIFAGERRSCSQLSIAGLDMLHHFLEDRGNQVLGLEPGSSSDGKAVEGFWRMCWMPSLETMAMAAESAKAPSVRQHSISVLTTNCLVGKVGELAPPGQICTDMLHLCIPLAGRRIMELRIGNASVESADELMIEFDLCVKLIFKPLHHHLMRVVSGGGDDGFAVWKAVLGVLEKLLHEEKGQMSADGPSRGNLMTIELAENMLGLASEHLHDAIKFLSKEGLVTGDEPYSPDDFSAMTWDCVGRMGYCKGSVNEWKQTASSQALAGN